MCGPHHMNSKVSERIIFSNILLIGCGKMGGALLDHWASGSEKFTIVDPALESAPSGIRLVSSREEIADEKFQVIIVAIKPQMIDDILPHYDDMLSSEGYVLSIAAGASIDRLSKLMGGAPVIRVMPNMPAAVGKGVSGLCAGPGTPDAARDHAQELMQRTGAALVVDSEDRLDRVTAVAGSGPAYMFEFARAWIEAARKLGFSRDEARTLALGTMEGALAMADQSDEVPLEELRDAVTSKGGTTAAGLDALNGDGVLSDRLNGCLDAAYKRAVELR